MVIHEAVRTPNDYRIFKNENWVDIELGDIQINF